MESQEHGRPPLLDAALEGAQLDVGEASARLRLQLVEEILGGAGRVGGQVLLDQCPDLGERVGPRAPPA
jgi:hypothetical protein